MRAAFRVGLVLLLASGCIHRAPAGADSSRLVITEAELATVGSVNAYEAIRRLRHEFLDSRGETALQKNRSQPLPTVYIDGVPLGGISELYTIPASTLSSIRLYRAWEATTKYGVGNMSGVLELTSKH